MSTLERFGISHLSASSLNLWRDSPGIWALRYLGKVREEKNARMWRGSAVEDGLHGILRRQFDPLAMAMQSFENNAQGLADDETDGQRKLIEPMLEHCKTWADTIKSPLIATQLKIEHWLPDIPIPIIGYADFVFEDGLILELKTTERCPSKPNGEHVRQVSVYMDKRDAPGAILYTSHVKSCFIPIDNDDRERAIGDLQADALSLIAFLSRCRNSEDAIRSLPMNRDHFKFPKHVTKVPLADILIAG